MTSVTHVFLLDHAVLEEHQGHLTLYNASVFSIKLPLWNSTLFHWNSQGYHHLAKLLNADFKQNGQELKLYLGLSQSPLFKCILSSQTLSDALKSCSSRLFTWVTKPSNRVIHTKMILVQCVIPLRSICILKFIACREWQLAQRDGFKGGIFHTVTSKLQWYSASGTFVIQFSSYKQNKQKPRTPSRFSSFTHLLNK